MMFWVSCFLCVSEEENKYTSHRLIPRPPKQPGYETIEVNTSSLVSAHLMSQMWTNESTAHEAKRLGSVNDQLKSLGVYVCV